MRTYHAASPFGPAAANEVTLDAFHRVRQYVGQVPSPQERHQQALHAEKTALHAQSLATQSAWTNTIRAQRENKLKARATAAAEVEAARLARDAEWAELQTAEKAAACARAERMRFHETSGVRGLHAGMLVSRVMQEQAEQVKQREAQRAEQARIDATLYRAQVAQLEMAEAAQEQRTRDQRQRAVDYATARAQQAADHAARESAQQRQQRLVQTEALRDDQRACADEALSRVQRRAQQQQQLVTALTAQEAAQRDAEAAARARSATALQERQAYAAREEAFTSARRHAMGQTIRDRARLTEQAAQAAVEAQHTAADKQDGFLAAWTQPPADTLGRGALHHGPLPDSAPDAIAAAIAAATAAAARGAPAALPSSPTHGSGSMLRPINYPPPIAATVAARRAAATVDASVNQQTQAARQAVAGQQRQAEIRVELEGIAAREAEDVLAARTAAQGTMAGQAQWREACAQQLAEKERLRAALQLRDREENQGRAAAVVAADQRFLAYAADSIEATRAAGQNTFPLVRAVRLASST
ncbi:hypothetical protein CXG81DRAFT_28987 [Caulochytrium protostelioides]|uniref:Trichohyalin-plectin-homology domain-containing protein n=1 Tax=Caulochytrium protostelioides TaxID=1555241 RepID=A0A4P9WXR5_9FUNG|nr:hypothetical protein CXG81DRAFT_28987 [Caulochytrium protostelioides]|eukprot:RKO98214.1 hypothetical protein CXG81DRAFT_28987 [Caulochytrium protostelioides]